MCPGAARRRDGKSLREDPVAPSPPPSVLVLARRRPRRVVPSRRNGGAYLQELGGGGGRGGDTVDEGVRDEGFRLPDLSDFFYSFVHVCPFTRLSFMLPSCRFTK